MEWETTGLSPMPVYTQTDLNGTMIINGEKYAYRMYCYDVENETNCFFFEHSITDKEGNISKSKGKGKGTLISTLVEEYKCTIEWQDEETKFEAFYDIQYPGIFNVKWIQYSGESKGLTGEMILEDHNDLAIREKYGLEIDNYYNS
jgi:hypothetical protein